MKYVGAYDPRPRALDDDPQYRALSADAKELYVKIYSRCNLSSTKGDQFRDSFGVFAYYTVKEAMKQLNCGKDKAIKTFAELESVGLIRRKRVGYGKGYKIYAKDLLGRFEKQSNNKLENQTYNRQEKQTDNMLENRSLLLGKADSSNNNIEKEINSIYPIIDFSNWFAVEELVKQNIAYDILVHELPQDKVDYLIKILVAELCVTQDYVTIGNVLIPIQEMRHKLLQINGIHIRHVCQQLMQTTLDIPNKEAYCSCLLWSAAMHIEITA